MAPNQDLGSAANSNGNGAIAFQAALTCPSLPARAHMVRIGTEKVWSLPYRSRMAFEICCGSVPPALTSSHAVAASTVARNLSEAPGTAPNAAQQRSVVLRLLLLLIVSPQPPSSPAFSASQLRPNPISAAF